MRERLLSIGEAARCFGVAVSTLRYYDELGLLQPAERRGSGRYYGQEQLERIALIQLSKSAEMTLCDIAELAGAHADRAWRKVARARLEELDEEIERAQAARAALKHLLECPSRDPVTDCPILAAQLGERVTQALRAAAP